MVENSKDNLLDKGIKIVQSFTDDDESWGVRELAAHLNYTVPTTHRILLQLKELNILEFDNTIRKYIVGTELIRISAKVATTSSLQSIARPFLRELAEKYEETICLLMLKKDNKKLFWADKINGPKQLQYIIPIGELQSLPYASSGKTILAFLDEELINEILDEERFSNDKKEKIKKEILLIRKNKYHVSVSERLEGSTGIGSPIFNSENQVIGSIILTAPSPRVTDSVIKSASIDIKNTADKISSILGSTK